MYQFTIYTPFSDIWRYLLSHPPALLVSFSFHLDLVGKSVTSLLFIFHFFDFSLGRIFFSLWPYLLLWWTGVHFTLSILSLIPPSTTWNRCIIFTLENWEMRGLNDPEVINPFWRWVLSARTQVGLTQNRHSLPVQHLVFPRSCSVNSGADVM